MSEYEKLPLVIYRSHRTSARYQVFIGLYNVYDHKLGKIEDGYKCFETHEEVEAYIQGLATAKYIYAEANK